MERALLDFVGRHPFLPPPHLAAVLGWPPAVTRRRRDRLVAPGLMRLVGADEVGAPAAQLELAELTVPGLVLVAAQQGLRRREAPRHTGLAGGGPGGGPGSGAEEEDLLPRRARRHLLRHLAHTLGANAFFASLCTVARVTVEAGGNAALEEWRNAAACARWSVRPDGYGVFRYGTRRHGFFLEYDRGTGNNRDYRAKLAAYFAYRESGRFAREYDGFPTILVVTSDTDVERRIAGLAVAAAVGRGAETPLLLTTEWRFLGDRMRPPVPGRLLGPIWRRPQDAVRRRWPALPGEDGM